MVGSQPEAEFNLKQGAPEPLDKDESGGITSGARPTVGSQTAGGDESGDRTTVLPTLPSSGSFVVRWTNRRLMQPPSQKS